MIRAVWWGLAWIVAQVPSPAQDDVDPNEARTQVLVLGMTHGGHRTSRDWGAPALRRAIRAYGPDVVFTEIPPDRWPAAEVDWREHRVLRDSRLRRFPEYTDALLPLLDELEFVVEPCAAWTQATAEERHAVAPIEEGDPVVLHSSRFDERMREALAPDDRALNEVLGAGGWAKVNVAHWGLIGAALDRHRGKRVLLMFGAGHKSWFLDRLRERADVDLVDPLPFVTPDPAPSMKERCTAEVVELHRFFEDWFVGRLAKDEAAFARFADALAPAFELVSPEGELRTRQGLLEGLFAAHGVHRSADPPFRIWVEDVVARPLGDGTTLVRYEEWQESGGVARARLSSAVFRPEERAPRGVQWQHVHETWIESRPNGAGD